MAIMPNQWQKVMTFILTGEMFPDTNEDGANQKSLDFQATKIGVDSLKGKIREAIQYVGDSLPGEVGTNFTDSMNVMLPYLDQLTDGLEDVSAGLRKTGMDIREAKWQLIAELIRLAVEIAVLTALSYFTGGASLGEIAVQKLISRARMLVILLELSMRLHLLPAITEAIEEAFQTLMVRLALMKWAPDGQRPSGISGGDIVFSLFFGAAGGHFASVFGDIAKKINNGIDDAFKNTLKDPSNKWDNNFSIDHVNGPNNYRGSGDGIPNGSHNDGANGNRSDVPNGSGGNKNRDEYGNNYGNGDGADYGSNHGNGKNDLGDPDEFDIKHQPLEFVADGAAESLAEAITMAVFYGNFGSSWMTFVGAGLSERVEAGLDTGITNGMVSLRNLKDDKFTSDDSRSGNAVDTNTWRGSGGGGGNRVGGSGNRTDHSETSGSSGSNGSSGGLSSTSDLSSLDTNLDTGNIDGTSDGLNSNGNGDSEALNSHSGNLKGNRGIPITSSSPIPDVNGYSDQGQSQGRSLGQGFDTPSTSVPTSSNGSSQGLSTDTGSDSGYESDTDSRTSADADTDVHTHQSQNEVPNQNQYQSQSQGHSQGLNAPTGRDSHASLSPAPVTTPSNAPHAPDATGHRAPNSPATTPDGSAKGNSRVPEIHRDVDAVRDEHADVGNSHDVAGRAEATADAERARRQPAEIEDRLPDLGVDSSAPAPDTRSDIAPVVARDGAQRQWIAQRVSPGDLATGMSDVVVDGTVGLDELIAAGVTITPDLRAQAELGRGDQLPLYDSGLSPVDQARLLMLRPGPWPQVLDVTAANATRRMWQEAYTDFANSVPQDADGNPAEDPSSAWNTAVGLVLPLEPHPVLTDSRYAGEEFRDAARQVANLLVTGGNVRVATDLADRLRHESGLPVRVHGGGPDAPDAAQAVRTSSLPAPAPGSPAPPAAGRSAFGVPAALSVPAPAPAPGPAEGPRTAGKPVVETGRATPADRDARPVPTPTPVPRTTSSSAPRSAAGAEVRTSEETRPPHPAAALSVVAAVPVRAPSRPYVDFDEGDKQLDEDRLRQIDELAKEVVAGGLRDLSAGLRVPRITVTGFGNGPRFAIGSSAVTMARWTGKRRADAVADALRIAIRRELAASGPALATVRRRWGREVSVADFPIVTHGGGRTDPVPGPTGTTDAPAGRRRAVIDVERSPLSPVVARLEQLYPELGSGSLSLDQIAELALRRPGAEVDTIRGSHRPIPTAAVAPRSSFGTDAAPDRLRALYDLVAAATAAGRATSAAALTAFHLSRQGLFSADTLLTAPDGTPRGRNWTGGPGREADTSGYRVVAQDDGTTTSRPWPSAGNPGAPDPFVISTANGGHNHTRLALADGRRWRLSSEEFAELLAMDPALAVSDPRMPVVLAWTEAGDMGLDLPRTAAFRSGRQVWAHTGTVTSDPDPKTSRLVVKVSDDRDVERPLGTWIVSEPDDLDDTDRTNRFDRSPAEDRFLTVDGRAFRFSEIKSVTLALDGRSSGRSLMGTKDQWLREEGMEAKLSASEWYDADPVTGEPVGAPRPVPWKGRRVYFLNAHGLPGRTQVVGARSETGMVRSQAIGPFLRRRPSLRRLAPDVPIVLMSCWADAPDSAEQVGFGSPAPFAADRLAALSAAQRIANETGRTVFAPNRVHISWAGKSGLLMSVTGAPGDWIEVRPEPEGSPLDGLARIAGLDGPGIDEQDRRDTTLRLVRALRQTFGVSVEDDRDDADGTYQALLSGLGALESMRRQHPDHSGGGPFTLDLLERIIWAHTGQRPVPGTPPPSSLALADVRATLDAALAALDADSGTALSGFVALPSVDRARELLATGDLDARARQVLDIPPDRSVEPADHRRLLWATVNAVEAVENHPDADVLARRVLHLPKAADPGTPAYREALLWTAAGAAAVGRDVHRPAALAAYDLQRHGAFDPANRVFSTDGRPVGRNWSPHAYTGRLGTDTYGVVDPTGGSTQPDYPTPWTSGADRGTPHVVVLSPGTEPDTALMPGPGGTSRDVPYEEIAELLRHDPQVNEIDSFVTRIVPVGLGPDTRGLGRVLANRDALGHTVVATMRPLDLRQNASTNELGLVMTTTAYNRNGDWSFVRPKKLRRPAPAAAAATPPVVSSVSTPPVTDMSTDSAVPTTAPADPPATDGAPPVGRPRSAVPPPTRPLATPLGSIPEDAPLPVPPPPTVPPPVPPPAPPPASTRSHALPPAWVGQDIDRRRPPRIDRERPAAPLDGGGPVRFTDGSRLPAYMGGVAALFPGLPRDILRRSYVFGQSNPELRGADQVAAEVIEQLPAALAPAPPKKRWRIAGRSLRDDVRLRLARNPDGFFGDGQEFTYRTADGRTRVLTMTARPYGNWSRFTFGFANPVKVDTMQRSTTTTGRTAVNSDSIALVASTPVGPVSLPIAVWGRANFTKSWGKRTQSAMQNQTINQTETRTTDGSHPHLGDVWYDIKITDGRGRPVDRDGRTVPEGNRRAVGFRSGFAVWHGVKARLADSLAKGEAGTEPVPHRMNLHGRPAYRLVNTEAYGPVGHIRDWALRQTGVKPDSVADSQLRDFFSTDGFHRMSGVLNAGRTTTPSLSRDSAGRSPLGTFSVEVRSGEAVRISETTAAELRDITQSTVRNERVAGRSKNTEIGGAVGPSFQFLGLGDGKFSLRVLFGLNARYGSSRSRSSTTGGTGAIKTAGQAKGDPTELYIVQKTITVTAPPDTKAPLPDQRGDGGERRGKLRKNPPRTWSLPPRSQTFQTWAVERMTRTEARRLAGLDRDLPRGAEPAVPPYLTEDDPTTLGMSRPEEFTFADGATTRTVDGQERTFPEHVAHRVLDQVARAYPGLIAPPAELNPDNPRWRDADHFQIVQSNTQEVLDTLTRHSMAGTLETMMTTGLRIDLVDSGRFTRGLRHVWIDARLTGRRFEGTQKDLRLRYSAPGSENLGGQQRGGRGWHVGLEGLVSVRDATRDNSGRPSHAGTFSGGGRYGARNDSDSHHGPSVTHEAMAIGTKGSHLHSYELTITARRGGFRRLRSLLRGVLFLNLLGTQPFVFAESESNLLGPAPHNRDPLVGRVLLSTPVEHVPRPGAATRTPHALHSLPLPMVPRVARDLALATPALFERAAHHRPQAYQSHPFLTLAVTADPALAQAARQTLEEASHGSWLLSQEGAPSHDAALRAFQSRYLTANFDQTSSPLAWRVSGLWDKAPYLNRSSVLAHRTKIVPDSLTPLTGPVTVDTETTIGGIAPVAGRNARVSTVFFGGQFNYLHSHPTGPGVTGVYGVAVSPYRLDRSQVLTVSRTAVAEINRKDFNRQVLVTGDVEHEIAAASSTVGRRAIGRRGTPHRMAWNAGRRVRVDDGWTGHIPEKSAYRLLLLTDHWSTDDQGGVPLYTHRSWSPQPWLLDNPFGGFPVNSLNVASVLLDFDQKLRPLGLSTADRDAVLRLASDRVVRALGKEMVGSGASVTAGVGRWGSETARLWIGDRRARARVELIPVRVHRDGAAADGAGPGFAGLGHSVELEEHRQGVETIQESRERTSGASVGTVVTEGVHTGNDIVRAAGPTYSQVGSTQQGVLQNRSESGVRIATATTTQAHGEYVTRYRLRLSLEVTDTGDAHGGHETDHPETPDADLQARAVRWGRKVTGRRRLSVVSEGDVGDLIEHLPLSLMRPDPVVPADGGAPLPDPLAPPALDPPGAPHKVAVPDVMGAGGWHDVLHPRDRTTKPFTLPEDGFKVRRVIGLDQLHNANTLALAAAYDSSIRLPEAARTEADPPETDPTETGLPSAELLAKALDTPLTRAGTGSAQNLEDGTGNGALTAFYDHTLTTQGYRIPGLTDRGFFGGADGDLALYSKPDFGRAQLLTVTDGMKHEAPKRNAQAGGMSATRGGTTDSSLGAGPVTSTQNTGTNQMGASLPGGSSTDSDAFTASGDRLASVNVKPNTTRSFLFAIPTTWLSVAAVRHHVKDSGAVRLLRGPFGDTTRAKQAVETDTTVLAWVREDIARDLGLVDDTRFPPKVAKAWDAVTKADKAWTAADKTYWDLRRGEGARLEAALGQAERNLTALTDRDVERLPQIVRAREALRDIEEETRSAEPAHDGWAALQADLLDRQRASAERRLEDLREAAESEVTAARQTREEAQGRLDEFTGRLRQARTTAEALADEYARVREDTDRLTRWHQLYATLDGLPHLEAPREPDEVTFTPPPAAAESRPPEPKKDDVKKDDVKKGESSNNESGDGGADRRARPAYARPPWQPDPARDGVRFDAATDHRTLTTTEPDGRTRVYDLHRPNGDGNGFFAAVAHGLGDPRTTPARMAARVARVARRMGPPEDMALDPDAMFHTQELETRIARALRSDPALRAAVKADGGRLTDAVRDGLTADEQWGLIQLHVQRARRWDGATADLAASLTARALGVDLTVVAEDGSTQLFSGNRPLGSGPLPEATVYLRGDSYLTALPRPLDPTGAPPAVTDTDTTPTRHTPATINGQTTTTTPPPVPTTPPPPAPTTAPPPVPTTPPPPVPTTPPEPTTPPPPVPTTPPPPIPVVTATTATNEPSVEGGRTDGGERSFGDPRNDGRDRGPDPDPLIVPDVDGDEAQRRWIAHQVTEGDFPADRSVLGIRDPYGLRDPDGIYDADDPVDRVRELMVRSGPWPEALQAVAARAARRIWNKEFADFADTVPGTGPETTRGDWDTAVGLVMPPEPHPVLADFRYAGNGLRDAVRQVAGLLAAGGPLDEARTLADRLRHGLGQRPEGLDGTPRAAGVPTPSPGFPALRTATAGTSEPGRSGAPDTPTTPASMPGAPNVTGPVDFDALMPRAEPHGTAPASPDGSLGSTDMDLDTPEPEESPTPAPPTPDARYDQALVGIFGTGITRNGLYTPLRDAVGRLDRMRQTAGDSALREGQFDLDAVAREVLLLDEGTPVTNTLRADLLRIAVDPAMAQAPGLATLTVFGLTLRGGLSRATALTASDGTHYGRNWIDEPGIGNHLDLNLAITEVLVERDGGTTEATDHRVAPWRPQPGRPRPFVILAGGNSEVVTVRLRDGTEVTVGHDVFIELLATDPVLAGLPKDVPVVLVVPYAGGRRPRMPRELASRLGREVWSTSGKPSLSTKDDGTPASLALDQEKGVPRGDWIRSSPGEVLTDDRTDIPEWERRAVSYTLVADADGNPQVGRAYFKPAELAGSRERAYRNLHRITSAIRLHPGSKVPIGTIQRPGGARRGQRVYHLVVHGLPGTVDIPQEDGTTYRATGEEFTGSLKRSPSLRRLRDQDWIYLSACWSGRSTDGRNVRAATNPAVALPPTADPLADIAVAQSVANGMRKRVRATDRVSGHAHPHGSNPDFQAAVMADAQGRGGEFLEFWPEPLLAELADRARIAGLHTDAAPVPGEILLRTLRLVRALRLALGPGIDEDPTYDDLLRGIGALESMWHQDPTLTGMGPFTMDLFQRAAHADRRDHGGSAGMLDAAAYRALLARAAAAPRGGALTDFVRVPQLATSAQQIRSHGNLQAIAASTLGLGPSAAVGETELSRLFWAQVTAVEWLRGVTDRGATAARVLHLNAPDGSKGAQLAEVALRAIAAGRNPYNLVELATFHLEMMGAFAPQTGMPDALGRPVGRNWGQPLSAGARLDGSVLSIVRPGPSGLPRRTGEDASPWLAPGKTPAYVVSAVGAGPGRTWLNLPGGRFAVPDAEVADLIARDPVLLNRDLYDTDIVLAGVSGDASVPRPGAPLPLRYEVVRTTARSVWASRTTAALGGSANSGRVSVSGSSAADWAVTRPHDAWQARQLPQSSPPAGQQPTVPTTVAPATGFIPLAAAPAQPPGPEPEPHAEPDTETEPTADPDTDTDTDHDTDTETDPDTDTGLDPDADADATELAFHQPAGDDDWLPGALADALKVRSPGLPHRPGLSVLLSGPAPADALHRWVESRLAEPDAAERAPRLAADDWAGARPVLTVDELRSHDVELMRDQLAYAALAGGLAPSEVTLSLAQRYRLLRQWRDTGATVTGTVAALAAADLGLRITIVEPGGAVRHFDPDPAGEPSAARP
ncbi:lonely Cys domain-containing protein [Streptomyces sp. NPDC048277]|uniref:lonely Cys domain-containing protein n=1 Tax=Streptomyces sp. NPDC048277 TaxID=3155027 RepID=UPI0033DB68D4